MSQFFGKILCWIGLHKEKAIEEFPSKTTTILGVVCERKHCRRMRCTVNGLMPRYPNQDFGDSVIRAKEWLESQSGSKVGRDFITFS